MPRPPLVLGSWGTINRVHRGPSLWVAYARYRDHDGHTRQMERTGATAAKAENALKAALVDRLRLDSDDITSSTTITAAGERWYDDEIAGRRASNTERWYRHALDNIITPGIGELRLSEVNVARMDRFIKAVAANRGPGAAKTAKTVLSGIFTMAAQLEAMKRNPLRDVAPIKRGTPKEVVALSLEQMQDLRRILHADDLAQRRDLVEPIDYLMGTGVRIGEGLALRWFDLDLDATPATAVVRATVVDGVIQETPKSASSRRRLRLPRWLADELRARREVQRPNDFDLVFPSQAGTPRDPSNVRKQWRELVAGTEYSWVHPHVFRKSVATLADDSRKASEQLGHADERTTRQHYIPKTHEGPDITDVLDAIGEPANTQRFPREAAGTTGSHRTSRGAKKAG